MERTHSFFFWDRLAELTSLMSSWRRKNRRFRALPKKKSVFLRLEQLEQRLQPVTGNGLHEYVVPTSSSQPSGVAYGPDSKIWFTEFAGNKIGKVTTDGNTFTEYSISTSNSEPYAITVGPDGNLWFTEFNGNKIGKITTSGTITEYTIPTAASGPEGIVAGPDGNLWFVESATSKVAKVTTSGTFTEYAISVSGATIVPRSITPGSDGNLWFTEHNTGGTTDYIGQVTTGGTITQYSVPTSSPTVWDITNGPDGNLWFTENGSNKIGELTTGGTFAEYSVPTASSGPEGITQGQDGGVWFVENSGNKIARIDPASGTFQETTVSTASSGLTMVVSTQNDIWGTEKSANKVAALGSLGASAPTNIVDVQGTGVPYGPVTLSPLDGDVRYQYPLSLTQSAPMDGDPPVPGALVYNSDTVNVEPILQVAFQSDPKMTVPTSFSVTLTWNNGTAQSAVTFGTTGHSAGDDYLLNTQVNSAVSSTGYYPYKVDAQEIFSGLTIDRVITSDAAVVVNGNTPFGPGWSLAGLDNLVSVTGGMLWVSGTGGARFFAGSSGTYISPPNDKGTLVKNGDNTFTYTDPSDMKWNFTTGGLLSTIVAPNGRTTTFTYNGSNEIYTIAGPDGGVATFAYDGNNQLNTITAPGGRVYTFTHDGTTKNLTVAEDPAADLATFTYNSSHEMTNLAAGNTSTTMQYSSSNGELTTVTLNSTTTLSVTPQNTVGLNTSPAKNVSQGVAAFTDALSHITTYTVDNLGRALQMQTADGTATATRDFAGQVVTYVDPLGKTTTYIYDYGSGDGELIEVEYPDGSNEQWQYNSTFHEPTVHIDQLGNRTSMTYDGTTGLLLTTTNPLNQVTTQTWSNGRLATVTNPLNETTTYLYDSDGRLTVTIDPANNRTTNLYDSSGNLTGVLDPNNNLTQYLFDADGRQTVVIDPLNNRTTSFFDAAGHLTGVEDPNTNLTQYLFDSAGRQTVVIDPAGNRTTSLFDSAGHLTGTLDADNNLTQYLFDSAGQQTVTIDALNNRTTSFLDAAGHVTGVKDAANNLTEYLFDSMGRQTVTIDALNNRTTSFFDAAGHLTGTEDANTNLTEYLFDAAGKQTVVIDALGDRATSFFDAAGQLTGTKDANSNLTQYLLDADGRQTVVIDALTNRTTSFFDAAGHLTGTKNANGNLTQCLFDADGRQTVVIDPLNNRTTSFFDAAGHLTGVKDGNGDLVQYLFDADGRQTIVIDGVGNRTTSFFDAAAHVTGVKDGSANLTQYLFDADGRQTVVIDAANNRTTSLFDAAGHLTGTKDPNSNLTQYLFDADGRQTVVIDALNNRTTSFLDAVGNLTGMKDASNNLSTFAFDALNRITSQTDALGKTATFAFDALGHMTGTTDRDGRVRTFLYDADGRETGETWIVSGSTVNTLTFSYDSVGNMLTAANNISTYTMQYDADNRVTVVNEPFSLTLTFSYDSVGNRTEVQDSFNSGITSSVYDAANELTTRSFSDGTNTLRADLTYTGTNQIATEAFSNNIMGTGPVANASFLFDADNRITSIQNTSGGASLSSFLYEYDAGGRLTGATENGSLKTYTYDADNQLTGDGVNTFTFDGTGNRTNTGYSTGTENQLTSNGTYSFTYDNEGNEITNKNISTGDYWTYGYDNKNEMTSAVEKTSGGATEQSITYRYDAFGNRIEKGVTVGSSTTTTRFGYDGWKTDLDALDEPASYSATENWDVWIDLDGSNNLLARYLRGDQVDQLFARIDSGTPYWELTDREDSIRTIIDNSGNVKDQVSYDGWGNANQTNSPYGGRYLWTGREFDVETQLQYNRARYYSTNTGRWLSEDPIAFEAGDSNLYRYANNSPLAFLDASGTDIYVVQGANYKNNPVNQSHHQDIVVDTWESNDGWVKTGKAWFSFGMTGAGINIGSNWLGYSSFTACVLQGRIFEAPASDRWGGTILLRLITTPGEDTEFLTYLRGRVGEADGYSVARHNCVLFSQLTFAHAKEKYGK